MGPKLDPGGGYGGGVGGLDPTIITSANSGAIDGTPACRGTAMPVVMATSSFVESFVMVYSMELVFTSETELDIVCAVIRAIRLITC